MTGPHFRREPCGSESASIVEGPRVRSRSRFSSIFCTSWTCWRRHSGLVRVPWSPSGRLPCMTATLSIFSPSHQFSQAAICELVFPLCQSMCTKALFKPEMCQCSSSICALANVAQPNLLGNSTQCREI